MTELLLVPIHVDALFVKDDTTRLIAPLADFSKIPYACWVTERRDHRKPPTTSSEIFNGDSRFTSEQIMRAPALLTDLKLNYIGQETGIHLHWSLPDALTVMRADPDSQNRLKFPAVPNRWLITSKSKSNGNWQVESQWVVESDYLYPEQATVAGVTPQQAITFPIVSADRYHKVLTNPPPLRPELPSDITDPSYDAVYSAPFRYMGRSQFLSDWKTNDPNAEYLHQFMPDGLTAVGYGDPLFAAIYTNCWSVFGFVDNTANDTQLIRYDILGWYDNTNDCMQLFASLARQKPGANLYNALNSEYKWKALNHPKGFPTLSVYYASIEVAPQLKPNPAIAGATPHTNAPPSYSGLKVAVGNTATEALSADIANTLAGGDQTNRFIMEDQLEAIGLCNEMGNATVDVAARFQLARQNKSFQPRSGGTIWSIQLRGTGQSDQQPSEQPTLPEGLGYLLNELNLAQAQYDDAWQEIQSLRQRVFADWYKFESAFHKPPDSTVIYTNADDVPDKTGDPSQYPTWANFIKKNIDPEDIIGNADEMLPYISEGSLQSLAQLAAQAGTIEIDKDLAGKLIISATSANQNPYIPNQYTLAQAVVLRLREVNTQLDQINATPRVRRAQQEFVILRKSAPRFWQPNEPAVLLKGAAVPATLRHGHDGRANDDDTLTCQVLSVSTSLNDGGLSAQLRGGDAEKVIETIQSAVESLRPKSITPDTIGFSNQSEEPWHPISLEWEVSVWPEMRGMDSNQNAALAGKNYQPGFVDANYEFDENASALSLKCLPSQFAGGNSVNVYSGRTTLTPGAAELFGYNIEQYLMGLTLYDLKHIIVGANRPSNELDIQIDEALVAWAKVHFTLTDIPLLKDQNVVDTWFRTQHIFRVAVSINGQTTYQLVDLTDPKNFPDGWYDGRPALTPTLNLTTFGALPPTEQVLDSLNTAVRAHGKLSSANVLAQSLGGFNNALLMLQQLPQLPIFDLSAMKIAMQPPSKIVTSSEEKYKNFARDVAAAVAGGNTASPVTITDFLPIRSGLMQISKLYLVDTFGQVLDVSPATILPCDALTISRNVTKSVNITRAEDGLSVYLAPRITQPARLNFRWLAAEPGALNSPDEPEMSDHPTTTPVCGWLIPNHLDDSLMVYDGEGIALGSILPTAEWEPAPGTVNRVLAGAIPNLHLRQLITYLITFSKQHSSYWPDFLKALDSALENIEPANYAQHEALALLIGRPIAVVRASLGIQLQGKPALNQKWHAILSDMYNQQLDSRVSNEFINVSFPVRLGEHRLFNDGLVGYWIEDENGYHDDKFYSSQAEDVNDPNIITHHETAITQNLALSGEPLKLTMLVDPRGEIHVTSGVLPTKQISIPPDQYAKVLKKLSVTFMTAPVLTDQEGIRLNLPQESGYSWSWLERPSAPVWVQAEQIQATDNTLKFTPQRLVGGWLKLTPEDK
jgi:hypothetical protein